MEKLYIVGQVFAAFGGISAIIAILLYAYFGVHYVFYRLQGRKIKFHSWYTDKYPWSFKDE